MFMLIGQKRCPTCGVKGKEWMKKPEVLRCPRCNAFFTEFGIVMESEERKEMQFS